jgi:cell division protein FtsB
VTGKRETYDKEERFDNPDDSGGIDDAPGGQDSSGTGTGRGRFRLFDWVNGPSRAIALAALLVLTVLFGRDVLSSLRLQSEIDNLKRRKRELQQSLAADSILLESLDDPEFLERYARERFLMRREGETVYMIEE